MDGIDRLHTIKGARTPVPGTPHSRAREAARPRIRKLLQIQRDSFRRIFRTQRALPHREDLRCDFQPIHTGREAEAKGHKQGQRHQGNREPEGKVGEEEEAGAGRSGSEQGQRGCRLMLEDQ